MLPKIKNITPIFCLFVLFVFCASAWAGDMQKIKAQMKDRKPSIDALKDSGALGEGADGYLQVRKNQGNAAAIVKAENADRMTVNKIIARQQGTTVDLVSKKVAATIRKKAKKGHWLQKPDGTWFQK